MMSDRTGALHHGQCFKSSWRKPGRHRLHIPLIQGGNTVAHQFGYQLSALSAIAKALGEGLPHSLRSNRKAQLAGQALERTLASLLAPRLIGKAADEVIRIGIQGLQHIRQQWVKWYQPELGFLLRL